MFRWQPDVGVPGQWFFQAYSKPVLIASSNESYTCSRTHGGVCVRLQKSHSARCNAINIWSAEIRPAIAGHVSVTKIIRENEHNVGSVSGSLPAFGIAAQGQSSDARRSAAEQVTPAVTPPDTGCEPSPTPAPVATLPPPGWTTDRVDVATGMNGDLADEMAVQQRRELDERLILAARRVAVDEDVVWQDRQLQRSMQRLSTRIASS